MKLTPKEVAIDDYGNKIVTLEVNGQDEEFRVSAKDKEGVPFPNFEEIRSGVPFDGKIWTSKTSGKGYIFPDEKKTFRKTTPIKQAMEEKRESISNFQDNKEHSIKVASTASMATQILVALMDNHTIRDGNIAYDWQQTWLDVRSWLWSKWDTDNTKHPPF